LASAQSIKLFSFESSLISLRVVGLTNLVLPRYKTGMWSWHIPVSRTGALSFLHVMAVRYGPSTFTNTDLLPVNRYPALALSILANWRIVSVSVLSILQICFSKSMYRRSLSDASL